MIILASQYKYTGSRESLIYLQAKLAQIRVINKDIVDDWMCWEFTVACSSSFNKMKPMQQKEMSRKSADSDTQTLEQLWGQEVESCYRQQDSKLSHWVRGVEVIYQVDSCPRACSK